MRNLLSILILVTVIVAAGGYQQAAAETDWQCPEGFEGQTLRIFSWAGYVAETTIPDFEEACGVTVEYFEYGSSGSMLTVMQAGSAQYDILVAAVGYFEPLIEQELVQELDYSLLPNVENITFGPNVELLNPPLDYLMLYQWGTIGIAYDSTVIDDPLTTWDDFFAHEGRVAWVDDAAIMLSIAVSKLGLPLVTVDEAQVQAAADYLLTVPQNEVFALASDTQADLLLQGEVDAIVDRSRNVVRMQEDCECDDFVYSLAEDGFLPYYDALLIPSNASNAALAHAFIDYILEPQVNADLSSALGSAMAILEARELVDEAVLNNGVSYVTIEFMMEFLADDNVVIENFGHDGTGTILYLDAWNRVKAELTQ